MAVQFAGSSSTGDRRRRRIVVNGDGAGIDTTVLEGDPAEMESQLVASAAAGPWVPVSEMRIWIYAAIIGLFLAALSFAVVRPVVFDARLTPLSDHLLTGADPVMIFSTQVLFLILSAQLGILIGWYRARCRLDFGGRYRVWPWAVGLFGLTAFCLATNTHRALGKVVAQTEWLPWRASTLGWMLPICLVALPISRLLDRDMRNSRSSLWMFRLSCLLWLTSAMCELSQPELLSHPWFQFAHLLIPVFASATLFLGLWLHARIVAYVCPDPPELDVQTVSSYVLAACTWIGCRLMFWRRSDNTEQGDEESKPRRRRKKAEGDEVATQRKRKTPARRTTSRTRTRTKLTADEDAEESGEMTSGDESESENEPLEDSSPESTSSWNQNQEQWDDEPADSTSRMSESRSNGRFTKVHRSHGSSAPAPHSMQRSSSWRDEMKEDEEVTSAAGDSNDETDDDRQFQLDSGMTADQMKGLSKRQKRELKKQLRDQERARGR